MTETKQTKCPHCGSSFRISQDQLSAKGGSVRCGSCLQIFRADLHLVGAAAPATPVPAPPKPKVAKGDESWALDLVGEKPSPAASSSSTTQTTGDDDFGFSDDDIADFMDNQDQHVEAPRSKTLLFDDEINEMLDDVDGLPHHQQPNSTAHHSTENADESWAKDILSELEDEEKKKDSQKYGMEILDGKSKAAPKNAKLAAALGMGPRVAEEPVSTKNNKPSTSSHDGLSSSDNDILSFLDDDDLGGISAPPPSNKNPFGLPEQPLSDLSTPVTLKPIRAPINWGHLLSWTVLCLIAIAMFIGQYTYFNFESLAINPAVRPLFEDACQQIGCRLPDIPDPSKLHITDVVARKHPKAENALVVDAILRNDASFPQNFPALRLHFSNSADEVVASRILRPSEYLMGEAKLLRRIPPDTPIRISLEIVDPGQEAVNYGINPLY